MSNIRGEEKALAKVFSSDYDFHIPEYQRPYAWTGEHASELFSDLWSFHHDEAADEEYFLGSIVLVKEQTQARSDVVDGQQRLTTLTLLLAAISHSLTDEEAKRDFQDFVREPGNRAKDLQPSPRLNLRKKDREFFRAHVQEPGGLAKLAEYDARDFRDSQFSMVSNGQYFLEKLAELSDEEILAFGQFVVQRCKLVVVSTDSLNSAYRIFSVLNDRGLDLEPSDILKAQLIGGIKESERARYTERWEEIEEDLGRAGFNALLGHLRMIFRKQKAKRSIVDEFRDYVVKAIGDERAVIDQALEPYAGTYAQASQAAYVGQEKAEGINDALRWLNELDFSDWMPLAMELLHRFRSTPERLLQHLQLLERLAGTLYVRGVYVTPRFERFGAILSQLESGADLMAEDSPLRLTPDEEQSTLTLLDGPVYEYAQKRRKYILLRLDSFMTSSSASYNHRITTIEHVLPQNPASDSEWRKVWTDDDREHWLHRIGNLVLLDREKNPEASNYDFAIKKEKYFRSKRKGIALFASAVDVANYEEWNLEIVAARQTKLLEAFQKGWNLSRSA
jgi:hypothetical protein